MQCRQDFFDESSLTVGFSFGLKLRIDSFSMRVLLAVAEQVAMVRSVLLLLDAVLEGEGAQTPISLMLVNTISTISAMIALSLMRKLVSNETARVILVTQFLVFVLAMEYSIFEFLGRQALIPCTPALPEVTSSRFIYRMLLMYELSAISFVITGCLLIRNRHYSVSSAPDRTMLTAET